ncbi:MAG: hypothetical protein ACREXU_22165, partial [Gammaproteobacteria bacterium]
KQRAFATISKVMVKRKASSEKVCQFMVETVMAPSVEARASPSAPHGTGAGREDQPVVGHDLEPIAIEVAHFDDAFLSAQV